MRIRAFLEVSKRLADLRQTPEIISLCKKIAAVASDCNRLNSIDKAIRKKIKEYDLLMKKIDEQLLEIEKEYIYP
ncbi:MAG: hypothetical protein FWF54_08990 [Candidatus Azobacteroides sp.]|nr:hypothetical protein [Candidatus Azobacteroides sp.]